MGKIDFPKPLKLLFEDSDLQAPIRALADRVGYILADNKLPFFPNYTDHGVDHINSVLKSEVDLVPNQVWKESEGGAEPSLLRDADAAVLIGATLLHDIAMHIRPDGFKELIEPNSRFQPLPWFKDANEGTNPDRPWHDLWEDYKREARRFSDRTLGNIIGMESSRSWKFGELPANPNQWDENQRLVVGEFLRRHHARLAHEIAIYGFPGLPVGNGEHQFPAMGQEEGHPLRRLADLIGLAARSHGISLRVCQSYINASSLYRGTPTPMGTAVLYPMALLRVADYLQIDHKRAPTVLLQLRNPQSPTSIKEWKKHRAVQNIGPATDPRGKMVTVSADVSLEVYLQLRELVAGLQAEMDHSIAVLDENYGARGDLGLDRLSLSARRVYSNLNSPAFRDSLPYIPEDAGFSADPNLLTLLVEPLYGQEPGVGVRELMQNGVDAVRDLHAWCHLHKKTPDSLDLADQDADVLIDFVKREDSSWILSIQDKGIGMKGDTIRNYFLRAGASFRQSNDWAQEFLDPNGRPRVLRAGRFGIGAFAVFLLGSSFSLWTRHVTAGKSMGYMLKASSDSNLIEIKRVDNVPVGTKIEIELSTSSASHFGLSEEKDNFENLLSRIDWYCWSWPQVLKRVCKGSEYEVLNQTFTVPLKEDQLESEWATIYPKEFDQVFWTFKNAPYLVCNGLAISQPRSLNKTYAHDGKFEWPEEVQLERPRISVLDREANLALTTQRYGLAQPRLPFTEELMRDVTFSFIAHALVDGPVSREQIYYPQKRYPLSLDQVEEYGWNWGDHDYNFSKGNLSWVGSFAEFVPSDPWLYSLLKVDVCLVRGLIGSDLTGGELWDLPAFKAPLILNSKVAVWQWIANVDIFSDENMLDNFGNIASKILESMALNGIKSLGVEVDSSCVVAIQQGNVRGRIESYHFDCDDFKISNISGGRRRVEICNKFGGSFPEVDSILSKMGKSLDLKRLHHVDGRSSVLFAALINAKPVSLAPESIIAKIWNECLGERAIPFDPAARKGLTEDGRRHPELRRHIEAWEKIKQNSPK